MDAVDHRSDLWAVGIILYEMLAGKHPLEPVTQARLFGNAAALDQPMPSIADDVPGLPDRLVAAITRCLAKRKHERYATAAELLADLLPLSSTRTTRGLGGDDSPYPGLHAFQEADSNRFFGRTSDVAAMVARLRDQPLVAVVGPSGVGKSSFVRAGVVPALKGSGEPWEAIVVRPGRQPLAALAGVLESLRDTRDSDPVLGDNVIDTLRREPGTLGARLRSRARRRRCQILLFVDQHEELYTLVADPGERRAFTACLAGAADDAAGPLRVVVAMRSDFLDRAAEDRRFVEELTRGLLFLQPPSRAGLEEALVQPLEMLGYSFEAGIVNDMLETLEATPGSLPLLQFTAAKLWETRDPSRRVLAREGYLAMGGVVGALATHADQVLAGFSPQDQQIVRTLFLRLVTPERTRAIVEVSELRDIRDAGPGVQRVVDHLVAARLLVVHTRGADEGAAAVELVHESLIKSWPRLVRWLDENQEDASFIAQLRATAKQWEQKGRAQGLLWRNEAHDEARLWRARHPDRELAPREQDFLDAVFALATRAARRRRRVVVAVIGALVAVIVAGGAALVKIRAAEQAAIDNAQAANAAEKQEHEQEAVAQEAKRAAQAEAAALLKANKDLQAARNAELDAQNAATKADDAKLAAETQAQKKVREAQVAAQKAADAEKARLKLQQQQDAKKNAKDSQIHTGELR
jgi:hypothetical protein